MATVMTTGMNKMEQAMAILADMPDKATAEIVKEVGCDPGTVARARLRLVGKASEPVMLAIDAIDLDQGTQMRPDLNETRELEFAALMADGVVFDPPEVYEISPDHYVLTDGFHRVAAAMRAGIEEIACIIKKGTLDDAMRAAARANAKGTLPRCPKTIRNAILTIIELDGPNHLPAYFAKETGSHPLTAQKVLLEYCGRTGHALPDKLPDAIGKMRASPKPKEKEVQPSTRCLEPANGHASKADIPFDEEEEGDDEIVVEPPGEDRAMLKAQEERDWLESLSRDGNPSVRDTLPDADREKFDRAALRYRKVMESSTVREAFKLIRTAIGDRKSGSWDGDPFSILMSRAVNVGHPRDWVKCHAHEGVNCQKPGCFGVGFKLN